MISIFGICFYKYHGLSTFVIVGNAKFQLEGREDVDALSFPSQVKTLGPLWTQIKISWALVVDPCLSLGLLLFPIPILQLVDWHDRNIAQVDQEQNLHSYGWSLGRNMDSAKDCVRER
jgi:hypothetical protein